MGGDNAPGEVIAGAVQAASEYGCEITVVGREEILEPLLATHPELRFKAASEVIAMDDHPAQAVRQKKDSSMSVCARLCAEGLADGWCSAGNSGAILAAALFVQGRIKGVERPALGTIVPTANGYTYFLDVGANVDSRPEFLVQQAQMGSVYARQMMGRPNPRVALLSNGEEASKGDSLIKEVYPRLEASALNFIGNVEGKDLLRSRTPSGSPKRRRSTTSSARSERRLDSDDQGCQSAAGGRHRDGDCEPARGHHRGLLARAHRRSLDGEDS